MKQSGMRRKLVPALVGVGVAVAAPLMVSAPASAASSDCPSGKTCIWQDSTYVTNGSGIAYVGFGSYIPDFSQWDYATTTISAGNNAISVYNNGNSQSVRLYDQANRGGNYFQLAIKTGDGNISNTAGYIQGITWHPNSGYFASYW